MPSISPPLPLAVRLALLTSLSPTKTLVPLLYSEVNGLPIYVTLSPAHTPHIGLLPLVLALSITSPLSVINLFPRGQISLDLDGNAPFVDLWAPLRLARELCKELGVLHLFFDEKRQGAGLLSADVEQMISWEENGSIIPSAYCLDILLSTSCRRVNIIPDDRYITTRLDKDRRARLVSVAEYDDPSRMRSGEWGDAWSEYLRWSMAAWKEFSLYPSRPPAYNTNDEMVKSIHSLLPRLASLSTPSHRLSYPLARADIAFPLNTTTTADPPMSELLGQLLHRIFRGLSWSSRLNHISPGDLRLREQKARIQLGVVELVGAGLVSAFQRYRDEITDDKDGVWRESLQHGGLRIPEDTGERFRTGTDVVRNKDTQSLEGETSTASSSTTLTTDTRYCIPETDKRVQSSSIPSEKGGPAGHEIRLRSEDTEGWWSYLSIAGTIALAYLLSMMQ